MDEYTDIKYDSSEILKNKKRFKIFIKKVFVYMKFYWNLNGFITSTIFPIADLDLALAATELKLPFIVIHKEGIRSKNERLIQDWIFKNRINSFKGSYLIVYNKEEKKSFIENNFVNKDKIIDCGCPRLDNYFKLKRYKPDKFNIVFFLIQPNYALPFYNNKWFIPNIFKKKMKARNFTWDIITNDYIKHIENFLKTNKKFNVFIKAKVGYSNNQLKYINRLKKYNITLIESGNSYNLIKKCKTIVAFQSSVIFEALAANRIVVSPVDLVKDKKKRNYLVDLKDCFLPIKKLSQIEEILSNNKFFNLKIKNKDKILKKYLGNTKGDSSSKTADAINTHLKDYKYI